MPVVLENQHIRLMIDPCGAQMCSMVDKISGQEQLWQPDEAVWNDSAPWLFPLIGQLRGGAYRWQGKTYAMPMHGFAGKAAFRVAECTQSEALLTLEATAETLQVYPWRFRLETRFRLAGRSVQVRATVRNLDAEPMYFSIGAHPGIRCEKGDRLLMNNASRLPVYRLNEATHLLRTTPAETLPPQAELTLTEALFDEDAMLLRGGRVTEMRLCRQSRPDMRFRCDATPWLGLWSRKRAGLPYLCIEPWFGVDDPEDAEGDITRKMDVQLLQPGAAFEMRYEMALLNREGSEG